MSRADIGNNKGNYDENDNAAWSEDSVEDMETEENVEEEENEDCDKYE